MRICKECSKTAIFGYITPEYCKIHKKDNMVNVKHKRCMEQGCNKIAQDKTEFCISHGGGNRCKEDGCKNGALHKTELCVSHGGGKRCKEQGCNKCAAGKSDFCKKHGTPSVRRAHRSRYRAERRGVACLA